MSPFAEYEVMDLCFESKNPGGSLLKSAKCKIFGLLFFTLKSLIWVGDSGTEKKFILKFGAFALYSPTCILSAY
jgi:hypothetical protein